MEYILEVRATQVNNVLSNQVFEDSANELTQRGAGLSRLVGLTTKSRCSSAIRIWFDLGPFAHILLYPFNVINVISGKT
jgi:hypothetical protein